MKIAFTSIYLTKTIIIIGAIHISHALSLYPAQVEAVICLSSICSDESNLAQAGAISLKY